MSYTQRLRWARERETLLDQKIEETEKRLRGLIEQRKKNYITIETLTFAALEEMPPDFKPGNGCMK